MTQSKSAKDLVPVIVVREASSKIAYRQNINLYGDDGDNKKQQSRNTISSFQ